MNLNIRTTARYVIANRHETIREVKTSKQIKRQKQRQEKKKKNKEEDKKEKNKKSITYADVYKRQCLP